MGGEDDWEEPRLFLAEQSKAIRRELASLMIPVLLVAAVFCALGASAKEKPQLAAAQDTHRGVAIDQH
jgi:hypothetical protein